MQGEKGNNASFPFYFLFFLDSLVFSLFARFHRRQFPPTLPFLFSFFIYRHRRIPFALAAAAIRPRESNYFLGLEGWGGEGRRLKWAAEEEEEEGGGPGRGGGIRHCLGKEEVAGTEVILDEAIYT